LNNPEYAKIGDKKYKINTDYRVALECNKIAEDNTIGNYEKSLAIIYKLFGDDGLDDLENHEKLLDLGQKFLLCGKEFDTVSNDNPDMDFEQDFDYIEASFMSDYKIDIKEKQIHWWTFFNLMNGLSNSEMGNCCVLSKVRNLRNEDLSKIKDQKTREAIAKAQKQVALKKLEKPLTQEEIESIEAFNKLAGIK
jgi:hypothetical protein